MWSGSCFLLFLLTAICANILSFDPVVADSKSIDCGDATRLASVCQIARLAGVYLKMGTDSGSGLCLIFLEGVGANHRMRCGRLTPSRKVGGARSLKYARLAGQQARRDMKHGACGGDVRRFAAVAVLNKPCQKLGIDICAVLRYIAAQQ